MSLFFLLVGLFFIIVFVVVIVQIVKYGFVSVGEYGEKKVEYILKKLDPNMYMVINDLMLKTANGSTQIDHVVVSAYGIFVIETKCYQGWIYGSEDAEYWTQNIYGRKYQLFNPLRQNNSHIRAMRKLIGDQFKDVPIEPVVVFAGSATISENLLNNRTIYSRDLLNWIYQFSDIKIRTPYLAYNLLKKNNMNKEQRQSHVLYVQQVQQKQEEKIEKGICPRCGGELIYRKGRYGHFWGCNNYPRCRFTLNCDQYAPPNDL